jgi:hypothetical protein
MVIQRYFSEIKAAIDRYAILQVVVETDVDFELRSGDQGYLHGSVQFVNGSILYFKEFLDGINDTVDKLTYSYHYQDANNDLIFRYDNAAHKPALPFHEHKHLPHQILPAPAPALIDVLTEIFVIQS